MLINSYVAVHACIFRQLQRYLQPVSNFQIISNSSRRMDKVAGDKMTRVASIVIIHLFIFFFFVKENSIKKCWICNGKQT